MRVLIGCEESQTVCKAFRARGHEAFSCDVVECSGGHPEWHIVSDVLKITKGGFFNTQNGDLHEVWNWDLGIFHPPCTRLCNSGVCWLEKRNLWAELDEATAFFKALLECGIQKIAIENPIPHKYALQRIGRKYDQIIHPWQFGHGEMKATCLWLRGLPKLQPTNIVDGREQRLHRLPPSPTRAKERSKTYPGIGEAMAEQWGSL